MASTKFLSAKVLKQTLKIQLYGFENIDILFKEFARKAFK
jgi:hypothetical protein